MAVTDLGIVLHQQGQAAAARQAMRRALDVNPAYHLARNHLGYLLMQAGRLAEALACFDAVLAQGEDAEALSNRGDALVQSGQPENALLSYERALAMEPQRYHVWNNLGNALGDLGRTEQARGCYERALQIKPGYGPAKGNLRAQQARFVSPWHFEMLADQTRNQAYQRAIERAVRPGMHVLDIGTGSGLLALMAARAGAARVTACELFAPAAAAAAQNIQRNGFASRIQVLPRNSSTLRVRGDLPRKVDLVVSEILDSKLIGEGVLPSVRHALANLAVAGARVIPQAAEIYVALVELPALRQAYPLREVCGFDLSAFDALRDPSRAVQVHLASSTHRLLSDPVRALSIDFHAPPAATADSAPHTTQLSLPVVAPGTAHAFVFWFDLHLDAEVRLSSQPDPASDRLHWRQVVQFLPHDCPVLPGQRCDAVVSHSDWRLQFALVGDTVGLTRQRHAR